MDTLKFRSDILKASKELTQENVEEIKYLLKGQVGEGVLENIKTSLDLFNALEQLGWISPNSLEVLYKLLEGISRGDIVNTLKKIPAGSNAPEIPILRRNVKPDETIDRRVLDNVANHIAADWKRLGRCLDIPESKIDQIDLDCRKAYEKAIQTLRTWTQALGHSASWDILKNALVELPRYDIIRMVETNFPTAPAPVSSPPPNPPPDGNPGYMQATSISEDVTGYTALDSNIMKKMTNMQLEEDKHGIKQSREADSSGNTHEPMTTTCIAESNTGPKSAETVLTSELKNDKSKQNGV